uniref:Early nodulin-40 n=1 Tax=Sesbania rostrata TaxID=3895 RepID=NO40_SESRO|nr:RecName: Full=Early nodulin-40 [Sesbania rostrata]CAA73252.1 early nodulin 40 [Sesbania rostrata]
MKLCWQKSIHGS